LNIRTADAFSHSFQLSHKRKRPSRAFFRFIIEAGEGIYSLTLTLRVAVPALPALALRLNPIL